MTESRRTFIDRSLLYLFSYDAEVEAETMVLAFEPGGVRSQASGRENLSRIYHIASTATVPGTGAKVITGRVRSANDFFFWREDDVETSSVRINIQTDDGANIIGAYDVVADLGSGRYRDFVVEDEHKDEDDPIDIPIVTTPRFATASPEYTWLNDLQCVGFGLVRVIKKRVRRITYDVYALT